MFQYKHFLGRRLLFSIIAISAFFSFLATSIQLYSEYQNDISQVEIRLNQIKDSSIDSLAFSLWNINEKQLQIQLKDLLKFPDITYIEMTTEENKKFTYGYALTENTIEIHQKVTYNHNNRSASLGNLIFQADLQLVQERMYDRLFFILITQMAKTFIVSFFILLLVSRLITRHLKKMAQYTRDYNSKNSHTVLQLSRTLVEDELETLVININQMNTKSKQEVQELSETKQELTALNQNLEERIHKRTEALHKSLDNLKETQSKLLQTQKQSALANLVAGIAHEMNTPLGNIVTSSSLASSSINQIINTKQKNQGEIQTLQLANQITVENTNRLVKLMQQFKKLSSNEQEKECSSFDVIELTNNIIYNSVAANPEVNIDCKLHSEASSLLVNNYQETFIHIIESLLQNSITHAFENEGQINITITKQAHMVSLEIQDNGKGIPNEIQEHIFEPFISTTQNNIGLGLHLCYNLAHHKLGGELLLIESSLQGTRFLLQLSDSIETL
jgi:signal transduction histidine kinase